MKITTARILARIFLYTVGGSMVLALVTCGGFTYWWAATSQGFIEGPGLVRGEDIESGMRSEDHQVPRWSRDGRLIGFSHGQMVYVVEPDGSGLRRVAGNRAKEFADAAQSPSISPDGTRMAYAAYKHDRWWLPEIEDYQWDIVTSALARIHRWTA